MTDGTALLGCCHKTYFTDPILIHMRFLLQLFTLTSDKTDSAYEDTHQEDHFDVILCVFGHLSATSYRMA